MRILRILVQLLSQELDLSDQARDLDTVYSLRSHTVFVRSNSSITGHRSTL